MIDRRRIFGLAPALPFVGLAALLKAPDPKLPRAGTIDRDGQTILIGADEWNTVIDRIEKIEAGS